jgi:hypothetical protein
MSENIDETLGTDTCNICVQPLQQCNIPIYFCNIHLNICACNMHFHPSLAQCRVEQGRAGSSQPVAEGGGEA